MRNSSRKPSTLLLALFFVGSGFSALAYQVILSRYAQLIVGATAFAVSALLTAFMLGMSLGAAAGGRLSDRTRHPLRVYALAEGAIGLYCLSFPLLFPWFEELYLALVPEIGASPVLARNVVRFLLGVSAFLLPTFFMGLTTPARPGGRERPGRLGRMARPPLWLEHSRRPRSEPSPRRTFSFPCSGLPAACSWRRRSIFGIALVAYRSSSPVRDGRPAPDELSRAVEDEKPPRDAAIPLRWIGIAALFLLVAGALDWAIAGVDPFDAILGFLYRRSLPLAAALFFALAAILSIRVRGASRGATLAVFLLAAFASGSLFSFHSPSPARRSIPRTTSGFSWPKSLLRPAPSRDRACGSGGRATPAPSTRPRGGADGFRQGVEGVGVYPLEPGGTTSIYGVRL